MLIKIVAAFSSTRRLTAMRFLKEPSFWLLFEFIVGIADFHSTHRITAIKVFFKRGLKTVDVGAAQGRLSVELALSNHTPITALAYTEEEVNSIATFVNQNGLKNLIKIGKDDAQKIESIQDAEVEQVLMIDVLEHVKDDAKALEAVYRVLVRGGYFLISVPTPNYPHWFGFEMERRIGHLRHYTFESLKSKLDAYGFTPEEHFYYTSGKVSLLCNLWYDRIKRPKIIIAMLPVFLFASLFFESFSNSLGANSCLLVLARKK